MKRGGGIALFVVALATSIALSIAGTAEASSQYSFAENLKYGTHSEAVTRLQDYLYIEGYFAASSTGYFGDETFAAVKAWQKENGVPETGFFGPISRSVADSSLLQAATDALRMLIPTESEQVGMEVGLSAWVSPELTQFAGISGVQYVVDGTDYDPPQSPATHLVFVSLPAGVHTVFADAESSDGSQFDSVPIRFTVSAPVGQSSGSGISDTTFEPVCCEEDPGVTIMEAQVAISPTSTSLSSGASTTFIADVTDNSDTSVNWSASLGTINQSGLYTAPTVYVDTTDTVTVTATQSSNQASAIVSITPLPITVTVSPTSTSLSPGATTTFSANVLNATNTAVNWSATEGNITAGGVYTAPIVAPTSTFTITATSQIDSSASGTASVTVGASTLTVSPTSTTLAGGATTTFSAAINGTATTSVDWSATGGTISSSGLYTAPSSGATSTYIVTASSTLNSNLAGTSSVTVSPVLGLVYDWPLDEGTGTTAFNSASSSDNGSWNGTPSGTSGYYSQGLTNGSYAGFFDGSDNYITTPTEISFSPSQPFSWSMWVYLNSGNNSTVVIIGDRDTSQWAKITPTAFEFDTGGIISHNIPTGAWHFITVTRSGNNFNYYDDGVNEGNANDSGSFSIPFYIGADPNFPGDGEFSGEIADVRIYDTTLSTSTIQNLYNSGQ